MTNSSDKRERAWANRRQGDLQRLEETRQKARGGLRLKPPRHLHAALELGKRYRAAKISVRFSEEDFITQALDRLDLNGRTPGSFHIRKHVLDKAVDAITPEVRVECGTKAYPQRGLSHYLAAIRAIAAFTGEDEVTAQIDFLRTTKCWDDAPVDTSSEANWTSTGNLTELLHDLSASVAHRHDLLECLSYDFPRFPCEKGAAGRHLIYAGQRRRLDRIGLGLLGPFGSLISRRLFHEA